MQEEPLDLPLLLERLRTVAAEHGDPQIPQEVPARAWAGGPHGPDNALREILLAEAPRESGLTPSLVVDDAHFARLLYLRMLGRAPDADGRAHLLERLRLHSPRTELMVEMALSSEAREHDPTSTGRRLLCRLLYRVLHSPVPGAERLVRAAWRRIERKLARRARRQPFGWAWQVATALDANAQLLHLRLVQLEGEQAASRKQMTDQFAALQLAMTRQLTPDPAEAVALADFFAAFEARFRGPVADLRNQLEHDYLGRLKALRDSAGDGPCLDLGCGRGVWMGLLRDHGFSASGVDLNVQAVAEAQAQGLDAHLDDVMVWLRAQPAASALAITAFHLVEHLPFPVRLAMVAECARVLKPGGLLVLETPNPENIWVGTHTFYHDPTHSQPLTPDSLEFLVNYHGLQTVEVGRLHPYPESARLPEVDAVTSRLNNMTCGGQDFVVIARKPR